MWCRQPPPPPGSPAPAAGHVLMRGRLQCRGAAQGCRPAALNCICTCPTRTRRAARPAPPRVASPASSLAAPSSHPRALTPTPPPARPPRRQVWYEYGCFCLRRGARGRGEQCFREALSLEPEHRPALLALLGCSVAEARATDPLYLQAAEATAHRYRVQLYSCTASCCRACCTALPVWTCAPARCKGGLLRCQGARGFQAPARGTGDGSIDA